MMCIYILKYLYILEGRFPRERCAAQQSGFGLLRSAGTPCCSMLQCVAVCCSVLQCVAVYCSVRSTLITS